MNMTLNGGVSLIFFATIQGENRWHGCGLNQIELKYNKNFWATLPAWIQLLRVFAIAKYYIYVTNLGVYLPKKKLSESVPENLHLLWSLWLNLQSKIFGPSSPEVPLTTRKRNSPWDLIQLRHLKKEFSIKLKHINSLIKMEIRSWSEVLKIPELQKIEIGFFDITTWEVTKLWYGVSFWGLAFT